jgi:hypothetical protein
MAKRYRSALTQSKLRSAITNGSSVLVDVDHRSRGMRRIKDLLAAYAVDLGGFASLSEGQKSILRRCVMLQVQLEMLEKKWAENEGGSAERYELELYQRTSNSLRRQIEALNLHKGRVAKVINDDSDRDEQFKQEILEALREDDAGEARA